MTFAETAEILLRGLVTASTLQAAAIRGGCIRIHPTAPKDDTWREQK